MCTCVLNELTFVSIYHFQAQYENINLSMDLQDLSNVTIRVDESKLLQVVRNVIRYLSTTEGHYFLFRCEMWSYYLIVLYCIVLYCIVLYCIVLSDVPF